MSGYWKLALAALLVDLAVALVYLADKKTALRRIPRAWKQGIIGLLFGGIAVIATEYGIPIDGATLNVRDAAPLCAGLIFGAPAGVIAGVIGGVERWLSVYWGGGAYTRLACSIATVLAGVLAGALRKHMFDDKKPSWFYGLAVGLVMEVLHMLLIFLTNMNDVHRAFTFVEQCSVPMVLFNGLAVMLAVLFVAWMGKEPVIRNETQKNISQAFQRWLLICVVIAFSITCLFTVALQTTLSRNDAERLLKLNISDVREDIQDASDKNLLAITRQAANRLNGAASFVETQSLIELLAAEYQVSEVDVIGTDGVITASTNRDTIGFQMADGEQSGEFLVLLHGQTELVQEYQPISFDASISRKYAGMALERGGFVQVGYDAERFQRDIERQIIGATRNRHVGEDGYLIISDENGTIVSDRNGFEGQPLSGSGVDPEKMPAGTCMVRNLYGVDSLCMYVAAEGYTITAVIPEGEAMFTRNVSVYVMVFMEIILFATLFTVIYFLIKRIVVDNIRQINRSLSEITDGNLDVQVNVRSNEEFASLSDDINSTVLTLKRYIAEAAARIDKELAFAKEIQYSSLPSVFPPFPNRKEFDLYARMDTAKEVGGDFYDFYFIDEDRLAFLIADVSGKGIPAAMFMMRAKTLIKGFAESLRDPAQALTIANARLCEGNDAEMFVTAWMGVLDVNTGLVTFANAGHNPPLLRHGTEPFRYLKSRAGFVLAGMEGVTFRKNELQLSPGDTLYLYTDGVTEATDSGNQLYGEDRLKAVLDGHADADVETAAALVTEDMERFVGDAPQFDDITMMVLRYRGKRP